MNKHNQGQSLVEALIALFIGAIFIGASATAIVSIMRNNLKAKNTQVAVSLTQELFDNVRVLAEFDWNGLYGLASKGLGSQYYASLTTRTIVSGTETLTIPAVNGKNYTRYFSVENVNRGVCGAGDINLGTPDIGCVFGNENLEDSSTQKITVFVSWNDGSINTVQYLTRNRNAIFAQTDWSGGNLLDQVITIPDNKFSTSTNIDYTTAAGSIVLVAGQISGDLTSSIFDTQRAGGAAFNSILWQGDSGDGTVKFQIASSNDTVNFSFIGPDGTGNSFYGQGVSPNNSILIVPNNHKNYRYIRYKSFFLKTVNSPRIDDIIINWSP